MDPKDDGLIEVLSFLVKVLFDYPTSKLVVPNLWLYISSDFYNNMMSYNCYITSYITSYL